MKENLKIANRVSAVSLAINLLLSVFKFAAGILAFSSAMISDAVHSASDCFSTIIVILGINISNRKADKNHPYGHERIESIAAIILSIMLFATAVAIGKSGVDNLIGYANGEIIKTPALLALIAAFVSIVVKEWMYWYTRAAALKINSGALMADAWHHRSDMLSSIGSLIGIGGAMLGIVVLDSIASLVIMLMILKATFSIAMVAVNQLIDKSADDSVVEKIKNIIFSVDGVLEIDDLKTRQYGNKLYVDVEIAVDGDLRLTQSHEIAENVHAEIEEKILNVKHCMVHVNPYDNSNIRQSYIDKIDLKH